MKKYNRRSVRSLFRISLIQSGIKENKIREVLNKYEDVVTPAAAPRLSRKESRQIAAALAKGKVVFRTSGGYIRTTSKKAFRDMSIRALANKPWLARKKA